MPREALLRFVLAPEATEGVSAEGVAMVDLSRTLGGRGLNLGPSPICIARAAKRGVFQRQWKRHLSSEDLEVLVARTRDTLGETLRNYLLSAVARGGFVPVASGDRPGSAEQAGQADPADQLARVEPAEARVLWEREEFEPIVASIAPGVAQGLGIARKIKALTRAVSEFTFARAGGIKRRFEPPEACEALERCEGGELRGSAIPRQRRGGAGSLQAEPDGRDG